MQAVLDALQAQDAAWALAASSTGATLNPGWAAGGNPAAPAAGLLAEGSEDRQPAASSPQQQGQQVEGQQQGGSPAVEERWSQWSLAGSSPGRSLQGGGPAAVPYLLSGDGSVRQQLLAAAVGHVLVQHDTGLRGAWGLGGLSRLLLRLDRVLTDDTSALRPAGSVVALFEMTPEPISWQVGAGPFGAVSLGATLLERGTHARTCMSSDYRHFVIVPTFKQNVTCYTAVCTPRPCRLSGVCRGGRVCPPGRLPMLPQRYAVSLAGSGRLLLLPQMAQHRTQASIHCSRAGTSFRGHPLPVVLPRRTSVHPLCRAPAPASVLCSLPAGGLCLGALAGASRAAQHVRLSCLMLSWGCQMLMCRWQVGWRLLSPSQLLLTGF
jgi:hypothetical protein